MGNVPKGDNAVQSSHLGLAIAAVLASSVNATSAKAASTVHVLLEDPSAGNGVTKMEIVPEPDHAKTGRVTFDIKNVSKDLVHEMLLLRESHPGGPLPYNAKEQRVIEAKTVKLVDTDDIKPGASVQKTVNLRPGAYEMICNQPGHYAQGMRAAFNVTR